MVENMVLCIATYDDAQAARADLAALEGLPAKGRYDAVVIGDDDPAIPIAGAAALVFVGDSGAAEVLDEAVSRAARVVRHSFRATPDELELPAAA
jgi:hypothetical protein